MPARRAVERKPVVHDRVVVAFLHPSQALVGITHRPESLLDGRILERILEWNAPALAEFFSCSYSFSVKNSYLGVFILIEHWQFASASPAPERLHYLLSLLL